MSFRLVKVLISVHHSGLP